MKKFLKDNTKEPQTIPEEVLLNAFRVPQSHLEKASKEKLVVAHNYSDKYYDVQITFNTAQTDFNTNYLIFVINKQGDIIFHTSISPSVTMIAIWERPEIPYVDLIKIQREINKTLVENKLPEIKMVDIK